MCASLRPDLPKSTNPFFLVKVLNPLVSFLMKMWCIVCVVCFWWCECGVGGFVWVFFFSAVGFFLGFFPKRV